MGKIFCIIGKSSTGKDTIYQRLLEEKELGLRRIVTYTTRPVRKNEKHGVEYFFCGREEKERFLAQGKVIEMRSYDTCHGVWDYFTVADEQMNLAEESYLLIGTLASYCKIRDFYGAEKVVPIYIEVEDGQRLERALRREQKQAAPKYAEMCRRFLSDEQDFSEEKLDAAGIEKRFVNEGDIEEVLTDIAVYIREEDRAEK